MIELRPAIGTLLDQTLDATYPHWHDGLSRAAYGRWFAAQLATPWGRAHLSRWALVDGDTLLATAKLYTFDATLDGRAIWVAGLGAIFTPPAQRGRGAGAQLVERLLEHAAADGADAALLFSEIGAPYYERLGFETIPVADLSLRVIEDSRRGAPATMVRAGDDRDLPSIAELDAVRAAPFRFHLNRDRDLVHYAIARQRLLAGLSPQGMRELQFFVAEEGSSAVAYAVIGVKDGAWTIASCGDRDPGGARLGAILQVLIAREPAHARPAIRGWLPASLRPPQLEVLGASPSTDVMMIRVLSRALADAWRVSEPLRADDVFVWKGDAF